MTRLWILGILIVSFMLLIGCGNQDSEIIRIGVAVNSNGDRLALGMHRNQVESILDSDSEILITYCNNGIVQAAYIRDAASWSWIVEENIAVGNYNLSFIADEHFLFIDDGISSLALNFDESGGIRSLSFLMLEEARLHGVSPTINPDDEIKISEIGALTNDNGDKLALRMQREQVESILKESSCVAITYCSNDLAHIIRIYTPDWFVAGGFAISHDNLSLYTSLDGELFLYDDNNKMHLTFDEFGTITRIILIAL